MGDARTEGPTRRAVMGVAGGAALALAAGEATAASTEITDMGGAALAAAIRAKKISAREAMSACLDRVDAVNPAINAVVSIRPREALMAEAAAADERQAKGETLPPLHGLPHAVKDLQAVKGLRFTQGSPIYKDRIAAADSLMVERLRKAGVIFLGKTNTPEFGLGSHTFNPVFGATHNPYDLTRSAGGSSGGAAAALAARMLPLADGSDYAPQEPRRLEQRVRLPHRLRCGAGDRARGLADRHGRAGADGALGRGLGAAALGAGGLRSPKSAVAAR